jgi:Carboxypeptidase regulatory-like domain
MRIFLRSGFTTFVLFVSFALCLAPEAAGQAAFGTIIGVVSDPSGGAIVGGQVTATDVDKGVTYTATSNDSGQYSIFNVTPGNYKISVEAKGFKTSVQTNVTVIVGQSIAVNVTLQVGGVGETVTVDAAPAVLETDRASLNTDLTSEQVISLPILDRNFTELELLLPGSAKMPWQHGQTENPQGGIQINTNGQLFSGTNFMIDGMDDTDPVLGIITINPPIDSVQGFNATTSNFDPEFSQAGGVVVQVETKSGTNEIHGSGFEFYRNNIFEARDPFTQPTSVPDTHWNQYGAAVGGPIKKDKLFYFFSYQGSRQQNSGSNIVRVPTAAERAGDLSALGVPIYDPTTGNPDGTGRTQFVSFPSGANANALCKNAGGCPNMIPTSRISTQAANLLATSFVPMPNLTPSDPTVPNYQVSGVEQFNTNQVVFRVDHFATSKLRYFGRYSYGGYYLNSPGALGAFGGTQFPDIGFEGTTNARNQNGVGGLNYSFSPTLLADFRFGVTKYRVFVSAPDETQQLATQVGIPGINDPNRPDTFGLPDLNINGTGGFQMGFQCNCPLNEQDLEHQGVTNWTKIVGSHTLKGGADIRRRQNKRLPSDQHRAGVYNFSSNVTALSGNGASGLSLASFLLGDPSDFHRFSQVSTTQQDVQWSMYYYAEDTWHLTNKLTLNYGLRWDTWFADSSLNAGQGGRYDVSTNTVYIPGVGGVSSSGGVNSQYANFSPRLGIAYSYDSKTVIRTGWGRSYFPGTFGWTFNTLAADVYPSIVNQDLAATSSFFPVEFSAGATPGSPSLGTSPPVPVFPAVPTNGKLTLPDGIGTSNIPTNQKIPYVDSYNLTVERVVFTDATLSLGYVGNVGRHLNGGWQLNAAVPGPGNNFNLRRPLFTQIAGIPWSNAFGLTQGIFNKCNCESSDYNALQAKLTKRFSRNYSILASYTWSKTLDFGEFGTDTNQYNYRNDHGPAVFDRASVFTIGHTVLLPFGRGQHFASDASPLLNAESGLPFEPSISDPGLNSDMGTRPDKIGNPYSGVTHDQNGWFNPAAYALPAAFTFGNASRNSLRGPGYFNADWGLDKSFRLTERFNLQLRWEVFNALNRANLGQPDNNVTPGNTDAGKIHDVVAGNPGQISMRNQQIGVRFTF